MIIIKFSDKLIQLRREKGFSQEQLGELMKVSRQSVSKWESGQATPELSKLVTLAGIFGVTLDNLIRDEQDIEQETITSETSESSSDAYRGVYRNRYFDGFEYKSKRTLRGIPFVHINLGYGIRVAKGIIAIGNISMGVISLGGIALGGLCFGGLGLGLLTLAGLAIGGLALGGIALGIVAIGGVAIGIYSVGGVAIAAKVAIGAAAIGQTAIGESTYGDATLKITETISETQVRNFILENNPHIWKPLLKFLTFLF